jgi:hypothetical protein
MIPDAFHFEDKYAELKMPVVIIAGEDDRLIDIDKQSARLHSDVSQSAFDRAAQNGHMLHQKAGADRGRCRVQKIGTFDLGGFKLTYGPSNNRGSDQVFLTVIQPDGSFKAVDRLEKSGT